MKSENRRIDAPIKELLRRAEEQQKDEELYQHEYNNIEDYSGEEDIQDEWEEYEEAEEHNPTDDDDAYLDEYEGEDDDELGDEEEDCLADEECDWEEAGEVDDNDRTFSAANRPPKTKASSILYNFQQDELWAGLFALPAHRRWFIGFTAMLVILVAYWNTKYNTQLRTLTHEEEQLKDLRYRTLYTTAELVRLERINSIEERIGELKLPLEHSSQPPYEIVDTITIKP